MKTRYVTDPRALELAERDPIARKAWVAATLGQDIGGVPSYAPGRVKSREEQRIAGGGAGPKRHDLKTESGLYAAFKAGELNLAQYRRGLDELRKAAEASAEADESDEDDEEDESDEEDDGDSDDEDWGGDTDARTAPPGPSVPARRRAAKRQRLSRVSLSRSSGAVVAPLFTR